jgi:hypothetical protein
LRLLNSFQKLGLRRSNLRQILQYRCPQFRQVFFRIGCRVNNRALRMAVSSAQPLCRDDVERRR